ERYLPALPPGVESERIKVKSMEMPLRQEPLSAPLARISEESSLPPQTSGTRIPLIGAHSGGTEELGHF
ncbi:MAG TPA: hypothetical protein VG649_24855, partial [Candidatus Angelobacter sp.]|nr:hypothetical protein [Candidatus Angelobacter sp.]